MLTSHGTACSFSRQMLLCASVMVSHFLQSNSASAIEQADRRSLSVESTFVEILCVSDESTIFALAGDRQAGIGKLLGCNVETGQIRELHSWHNAHNGMVVGTAAADRIAAVPLSAPALRLGSEITRFQVKGSTASVEGTSKIDLTERVLFDLQAIDSDLVGTFGYPGTTKLTVESLGTKRGLLTISQLDGNPAFSPTFISNDGKKLFVGIDRRVGDDLVLQCWSITDGEESWLFRRTAAGAVSAICAAGRDCIVAGTEAGHVYLIDAHTGRSIVSWSVGDSRSESPGRVRQCVSTRDGSRIAILGPAGITVVGIANEKTRNLKVVATSDITSVVISPEGKALGYAVCAPAGCRVEIVSLPK